jgi:hypothetical protein
MISILAIAGTLTATVILSNDFPAAMYITPVTATIAQGDTQQFNIMVKSKVPANAFTGEIIFDTDKLQVLEISYNTDVADLWVEEPWYNRTDNSIYFAGGTTDPNGFVGTQALITVTVQAVTSGEATFSLQDPRILAHDGFGNDIPLVTPVDALFMIDTTPYIIVLETPIDNYITIVDNLPALDINKDNTLNFQDIGVLLLSIGSNNPQHDFTGDGQVTWADIRQWQRLRTLQ